MQTTIAWAYVDTQHVCFADPCLDAGSPNNTPGMQPSMHMSANRNAACFFYSVLPLDIVVNELPGPKSGGGLRSTEVRVIRIGAVRVGASHTPQHAIHLMAKRSASEVISRGFGQGNRTSAHHQSEIASPPHDNPGHAEYYQPQPSNTQANHLGRRVQVLGLILLFMRARVGNLRFLVLLAVICVHSESLAVSAAPVPGAVNIDSGMRMLEAGRQAVRQASNMQEAIQALNAQAYTIAKNQEYYDKLFHDDSFRPEPMQVVTGVLTEKAQKENSTFYRPYPVFAYLPDRSTADCLLQIFGHIREVRSTVASHAKTRARISRSTDLCGGLLITLDLTKAFDAVPRGLIADSIKMLQLSEDLERAFLPCLEGGVYDIRHKGESAQVNSSRGIKQGRKEAPFKWCAATVLLLANLAKSKGLKWIHQHVLAYADDFILRWRYSSVALFTHATKEAAQFLHMLEAQGLKVSAEKSAALITMSGGANTRLYFACVWPMATYGVLEAGVTAQGARSLHGMTMRHLRIIARSPVHITHEDNERFSLGSTERATCPLRFDPDKLDEQGGLIHDSDIIQLMEQAQIITTVFTSTSISINSSIASIIVLYAEASRTKLSHRAYGVLRFESKTPPSMVSFKQRLGKVTLVLMTGLVWLIPIEDVESNDIILFDVFESAETFMMAETLPAGTTISWADDDESTLMWLRAADILREHAPEAYKCWVGLGLDNCEGAQSKGLQSSLRGLADQKHCTTILCQEARKTVWAAGLMSFLLAAAILGRLSKMTCHGLLCQPAPPLKAAAQPNAQVSMLPKVAEAPTHLAQCPDKRIKAYKASPMPSATGSTFPRLVSSWWGIWR
ncbi:unnamed protein product [Symbiodinium microadriaticum]|nr:unnamed protein product [Symbiodinium microadriaticum]